MDDERGDVSCQAADAARLAHVGARIGEIDRMDLEAAVRSDRFDALAGIAPQRLVVLQPLHLMKRANKRETAIHLFSVLSLIYN